MSLQISGKIKAIGTTQQVSDSFKKRDIVIVTSEQYPQTIEIQFVQDKCEALDQYKPGEEVTIDINIRGREWTNPKDGVIKYFNTINGWKIGYAGAHADAIEGAKHEVGSWEDEEDQLPF